MGTLKTVCKGWGVARALGICALLPLGLAGCAVNPIEGPTTGAVSHQASQQKFELFRIDPFVVDAARYNPVPYFVRALGGNRRSQMPVLGPGDVIDVQIWESSDTGLLTKGRGTSTALTGLSLDSAGYVFIPYAGRVRLGGKSVERARAYIQKRLEREVLRPQVTLTLKSNQRLQVSVTGVVNKSGQYPLSLGDGSGTLIQMIAVAGGPKKPAYRTQVSVIRNGRVGRINLGDLFSRPGNDVNLMPGDKVVLADKPKTYGLLGAVKKKGQYEFSKAGFYLIDALSQGGGLDDLRADAVGVFLFRYERPAVVNAIRERLGKPPLVTNTRVPVVYQLNMHEPTSLFFAKKFQMQDEDTIFVSNAPLHEVDKTLQVASKAIFLARTGLLLATP
ncbi:MAG TPA: hypothetical protein ENJ99_01205 [Rhizobiales bacterium]|nr:hypothetical protein [Hyphomicrobiales bacterium]